MNERNQPLSPTDAVTVRLAGASDDAALRDLAALDTSRVPAAPVLVAEVDGELWAARSLAEGAAVADPFRPSADLALLLAGRARQLEALAPDGGRSARRRRRPWRRAATA